MMVLVLWLGKQMVQLYVLDLSILKQYIHTVPLIGLIYVL